MHLFLNLIVAIQRDSYYPVLCFLMAWEETDWSTVLSVVILPLVDA